MVGAVDPQVTNVVASQRPGTTIVDVSYNLWTEDGAPASVSVQLSEDEGATWNLRPLTLEGDLGAGILPGNRAMVWNAGVDYPEHHWLDLQAKVTACQVNAEPVDIWSECFCTPGAPTYEEFPATGDPTENTTYDVLRMNQRDPNNPGFRARTYIQYLNQANWQHSILDATFYIATEYSTTDLGFYLSDQRVLEAPDDALDFSGLAVVFSRDSTSNTTVEIFDNDGFVTLTVVPMSTAVNFRLFQVQYDDLQNLVRVRYFNEHDFLVYTIIDWTHAIASSNGWLGFGGFAPGGGNQYLDDLYVYVTSTVSAFSPTIEANARIRDGKDVIAHEE